MATFISAGIAAATFLLGIIYKLVDLSVKFGRLSKTLESNSCRDEEDRHRYAQKFQELFSDRNRHEVSITRLDATMANIAAKLEKIDAKLDRLIDGGGMNENR